LHGFISPRRVVENHGVILHDAMVIPGCTILMNALKPLISQVFQKVRDTRGHVAAHHSTCNDVRVINFVSCDEIG
jgi:hypothetical protein